MFANSRFPPRGGRPRWRVLAVLAAAALALHACLLEEVAGLASTLGAAPRSAGSSVQVRTLAAVTPPAGNTAEPAAPDLPTPPPAMPAPVPRPRAPRPEGPAPAAEAPPSPVAADIPLAAAEPPPEPVPAAAALPASAGASASIAASAASAAAAVATSEPASGAAPAAPAATAAPPGATVRAGDGDTPVYRTVFPPPLTLRYGLRRGLLSGSGELAWRPDGEHYELRLEGKVAGLNVLTQASQGGFDHAGLAPLRFTDQRLRGAVRAANFQRERGEITFSGPSEVLTLLVGAQDRLSWMIQLAAIASAEPKRLAPGGKIVMYVVGARADGDVWVFRSEGPETVDTDAGPVPAVKFVREPRRAYDTQVEAWLDPARHHLPVRARLVAGSDGDALELLLHEMLPPP